MRFPASKTARATNLPAQTFFPSTQCNVPGAGRARPMVVVRREKEERAAAFARYWLCFVVFDRLSLAGLTCCVVVNAAKRPFLAAPADLSTATASKSTPNKKT
jgi:hypothetical protein